MGKFSFKKTDKKDKKDKPPFLSGITVQDPKGKKVVLSNLWKDNVVILKVLRRFGCPLCRYESRLLSELKPELDALDVKLCSIAFEDAGLDDFLSGGYWDWEIFIDKDKAVHKALELKKMSISAGLANLAGSATKAAYKAASKAGITGDTKGDGFQLGGTFVVDAGGKRLLYELRQNGAGSYASLKEVYKACGGDPDDIEEKAPQECISYVAGVDTKG